MFVYFWGFETGRKEGTLAIVQPTALTSAISYTAGTVVSALRTWAHSPLTISTNNMLSLKRWENWDKGKCTNWPSITQLDSGRNKTTAPGPQQRQWRKLQQRITESLLLCRARDTPAAHTRSINQWTLANLSHSWPLLCVGPPAPLPRTCTAVNTFLWTLSHLCTVEHHNLSLPPNRTQALSPSQHCITEFLRGG